MSEKPPADDKDQRNKDRFQVEDNLCVWMKANVVNFKLCDRAYDCLNCRFDKAMREAWHQENMHED